MHKCMSRIHSCITIVSRMASSHRFNAKQNQSEGLKLQNHGVSPPQASHWKYCAPESVPVFSDSQRSYLFTRDPLCESSRIKYGTRHPMTYVCIYIYIYTHIEHICIHIYIYIYTHICVIYIYILTYMYISYIYIYIHIYLFTARQLGGPCDSSFLIPPYYNMI